MQLARDASRLRRDIAGEAGADLVGFDRTDPGGFVTAAGGRVVRPALSLAGRGETALGDMVQSKSVEAAMLLRQNDLDAAEAALAEASAILDADPRVPRRWRPQLQMQQAAVAERRGDLARAEALLAQSIEGHRAQATRSRAEALALLALGRVLAAQARREPALQAFRSAFEIIGQSRDGVSFEDAQPVFDSLLAEAARDPERRARLHSEMFAAGQSVRSTRTAQSIALASARLSASDREVGGLIRELQEARRKRDGFNEALARAQTDPATLAPELQALEDRRRTLTAAIADAERRVQAAAPRYQQLLDAPVPPDAVLATLQPGEALFQILVGPSRSIAFFADASGVEAYAVELGARDAHRQLTLLRAPFDTAPGAPFDVARAHELFRALFGPVAARLKDARHLIVVPSGPLLSLPFGVLVAEPPSGAGGPAAYADVAWLAGRHAITLAPSVQSFAALRREVRPSQAGRAMIGFGDFVPGRDIDRTLTTLGLPEACRSQIDSLARLAALPASGGELQAAKDALRGDATLLLGPAFTEARIRDASLGDFRVVYFATHGLLPHDLDCWPEPLLVTSGPGAADAGAGAANDGLLLASEIAELPLDADLVVLSACNTAGGGGSGSGGESLSGLARSFFYAGARSLLVSHWTIPDRPTQVLMSRLFADLAAENLSTADALRRAQRAMIADPRLAHPWNWGAFSVVGDGGRRLFPTAAAGLPAASL